MLSCLCVSMRMEQRFEDMEIMINELRNEIENIRAEKNELEKQIHIDAEELRHESEEKQKIIDYLEKERDEIKQNLIEKDSEISRLKIDFNFLDNELPQSIIIEEKDRLEQEVNIMSKEIEEKDKKIEQLTKELNKKTHNLQQLVNTELWSKNKEIAKLHNHMTTNQTQSQLDILLNELQKVKINVKFINNNTIELNYENDKKDLMNIETIENYIQQLTIKKLELEKDVEYIKWLKLISKQDNDNNNNNNDCYDLNNNNNDDKYCELLKNHMNNLMKFIKEMIKKSNYSSTNDYKKMILDLLVGSEILSEDFVNAINGITSKQLTIEDICTCKDQNINDKTCSIIGDDLPLSAQSDSESFSEPDRKVSLARIGLQDVQKKSLHRSRFTKFIKTFSDSEDSIDYIPYNKTFQNDLIDNDASHQIQELKDINNLLYNELNELHNELLNNKINENIINEKLLPIIIKLEKSKDFYQKLQLTFDKKIINKHQQQNQQQQFDKKYINIDNITLKDINDKKTYELISSLNKENDLYKKRINKIDNDYKLSKDTITTLTKELDRLTLSHSQVLVENTKLTNDKLRLDQQIRKSENKYDLIISKMQEKFDKELFDLNQIIDSHRIRIFELENINKELKRQIVICETSDSAPSSSGISSIPNDININKQSTNDVLQNYNNYRGTQYWMTMNYQLSNGRSKSSCSPDLGIESDAAVSTTRPLKDTLKITESMTNLLSDEENCNNINNNNNNNNNNNDDNPNSQDLDRESPLHLEGLDEMEALKKENISLKKRLTKTRKALEDTFEHLSASNKNKKNVEKAITKQLLITKSILKKTRTYEEQPLDN